MFIYVITGNRRIHRNTTAGGGASAAPAPSSPTFLTYAPGTSGQAVLTWLLPSDTMDPFVLLSSYPITSLNIYHNTTEELCYAGAAGVTAITGITATDVSRTIGSLSAGTRWFSISATNANGEGIYSAAVKVIVT